MISPTQVTHHPFERQLEVRGRAEPLADLFRQVMHVRRQVDELVKRSVA